MTNRQRLLKFLYTLLLSLCLPLVAKGNIIDINTPTSLNASSINGDSLLYQGSYVVNIQNDSGTIGGIDLHGNQVPTLTLQTGSTFNMVGLGQVVNTQGTNKLKILLNGDCAIALNGISFNSDIGAAAEDYSALGEIDFNYSSSVLRGLLNSDLTLNTTFSHAGGTVFSIAPGANALTITNPTIGGFNQIYFTGSTTINTSSLDTIFNNQWGASLTMVSWLNLDLLNNAAMTSPTLGSGLMSMVRSNALTVGSLGHPKWLKLQPISNIDTGWADISTDIQNLINLSIPYSYTPPAYATGYTSGIYLYQTTLADANSELILDSSGSGNDLTFNTPDSPLISDGGTNTQDPWGVLTINATYRDITVTGDGVNPQSFRAGGPLKTINISGDHNVILDLKGGASHVYLDSSGDAITFTDHFMFNGGGLLTLFQDANLVNTINTSGMSFFLNTYKLNLSANNPSNALNDTIFIGGPGAAVFYTTFDSSSVASDKGGHIALANGTYFSLINAGTVNVNLSTDGVLPPAGREFSYQLIDATNGHLQNPFPNAQILFGSIGTNPYSTWHFDRDTFTLYTVTDLVALPAQIANFTSSQSQNINRITTELVNAYNSGNDSATSALTQITTSSDPAQSVSSLIATDAEGIVTDEAIDAVDASISQRIVELDNLVAQNEEEQGVSAGDTELKHGAWISPFYQQAKQKPHESESGYKLKNYGASLEPVVKLTSPTS